MGFNGVLSKVTVEPLYKDHLGDRRKWPLYSRVVAVLAVLAAGQKKEGYLVTTSLGFEFFSNSPVAPRRLCCQISAKQPEAETSAKLNKH